MRCKARLRRLEDAQQPRRKSRSDLYFEVMQAAEARAAAGLPPRKSNVDWSAIDPNHPDPLVRRLCDAEIRMKKYTAGEELTSIGLV
jgi:hypothetical protein